MVLKDVKDRIEAAERELYEQQVLVNVYGTLAEQFKEKEKEASNGVLLAFRGLQKLRKVR